MKPVTDPKLLAALNGGSGLKPVKDADLLAQLEGTAPNEGILKRWVRKTFSPPTEDTESLPEASSALTADEATVEVAKKRPTFREATRKMFGPETGMEAVKKVGRGYKDVMVGQAEGVANLTTQMTTGQLAQAAAGAAGAAQIANDSYAGNTVEYDENTGEARYVPKPDFQQSDALGNAAKTVKATQKTLEPYAVYTPTHSTTGKASEKLLSDLFEGYASMGHHVGAETEKSYGPTAGAAADFAWQAAPILLPFLKKGFNAGLAEIKSSETYRNATIKERGLVVQDYETIAKRTSDLGLSEADLARMNPEYFQQAIKRRMATEDPVSPRPAESTTPPETPIQSEPVVNKSTPVTDPAIIAELEKQSSVMAAGEPIPSAIETAAPPTVSTQNSPIVAPTDTQPVQTFTEPVSQSPAQLQTNPTQSPAPLPESVPETANIQPDNVLNENRRSDYGRRDQIQKFIQDGDVDAVHRLIYEDNMTGLLNQRAWDEARPNVENTGKVVTSIDMSGLKWVNDNLGHEAGDLLLKNLGNSLKENGVEAYRKGGDEFVAVFDNLASGSKILDKVSKTFQNKKIVYTEPNGGRHEFSGFKFDVGAGPDFATADSNLYQSRERAVRQGTRTSERGGQPYGLVKNFTPGGQVNNRVVDWSALHDSINRPENTSFARHKSGNGVSTASELTRFLRSNYPSVANLSHYGKKNILDTVAKLAGHKDTPLTTAQADIRDAFLHDFEGARQKSKGELNQHDDIKPIPENDIATLKDNDLITDADVYDRTPETSSSDPAAEVQSSTTRKQTEQSVPGINDRHNAGTGSTSTVNHADTGGYTIDPPGPQNEPFGTQKVNALQLPEIVEISKSLLNGQYPHILRKLNKRGALGVFKTGKGSIDLLAEIAGTPGLLERVLAHEVGHLVDWLPDKDIKRGNILGRIASLKKHMGSLLSEYDGAPGVTLSKKDRARIRSSAEKELKASERPDETVIETVTREVPQYKYVGITPDMIKELLGMDGAKYPKLYRAFQEMNSAEKKSVLVQAMKGLVHERLQKFGERIQTGTETITEQVSRTIPGVKTTSEAISKRYAELIQEEIDKRHLYKRDVINQELKDLTMHWKPFQPGRDPGYTNYRFSSVELYADAFSTLINDPTLLRKIAPTFEKAFFSYLERKPEVRDIYYDIQQRIDNNAEVLKHRQENIREMFDNGEAAKKATEGGQPLKSIIHSIYKDLIDKNADINMKVVEAKKAGITVADADNPAYWVETLPYVSGEVYSHLHEIDATILEPMKEYSLTVDDLGEYMMLKRITGDRAGLANPLGHTAETAQAGLDHLEQQLGAEKWQALQDYVEKYKEARDKNVINVVDKANMWPDDFMQHVRDNTDYATWEVTKFIEAKYGRGVSAQIYKQVGTLQEIRNPFIATVMKDAALIRAANIKVVKNKTTDFLKEHFADEIQSAETRWNGKTHEPIEPGNPDQGMIMFPHKGDIQAYYVPKGISDTFAKNPYEASAIVKAWQLMNIPLRAIMVNHNPLWMIANVPRDFIETWKNTPGLNFFTLLKYYQKTAPESWRYVFKGEMSPDLQEMYKGKMLVTDRQYTNIDEAPDTELDRMLEQFGKSPVQYRNKVIKPFMIMWDTLGKLGKFTEVNGKLPGYKYIKDNMNMTPEKTGHMIRSRVGTPDVHRTGRLHVVTNNIFLFSNVAKEGWRASWESFQESKAEYAWKTAAYNIIPKILMKAAAVGLFGVAVKQIMDGASNYDKTNYNIVPIGFDSRNKPVYFRIPQDYTGTLIGGMFWNAMEGNFVGDKSTLSFASEQTPYGLNPYLSSFGDIVQIMRGQNPYDDFKGKLVVPDQVFKAKDHRTAIELAKHEWNSLGGSSIYRFSGNGPEKVQSELEKALKLPGPNIIGRFLKVSDQGEREQLKELTEKVQEQAARKSLNVKEAIIKDIDAHDGKPTVSDKVKLYRQLLDSKQIDFDTKFSSFRPRYDRYADKVSNSPKIDAVIDAQGNGEKAALLQHYKNTMSEPEYQQVLSQLILEGHIKKGAIKEMELRKTGLK